MDPTTLISLIQQAGKEVDRLLIWAEMTEQQRDLLTNCANKLAIAYSNTLNARDVND